MGFYIITMENSKMKKWFILFLTVFVFALSSCWREDTTQSAKNEFSKYFNGKDEVVLNIDDNLYFSPEDIANDEYGCPDVCLGKAYGALAVLVQDYAPEFV